MFRRPGAAGPCRRCGWGEWFLSRRDGTIVARHEVPGFMGKLVSRPSGTIEPNGLAILELRTLGGVWMVEYRLVRRYADTPISVPYDEWRATRTEQWANRTTCSAVLPSKIRANAEYPLPPRTIKSAWIFSASPRISSYGIPTRTFSVHSIPGVLISWQSDSSLACALSRRSSKVVRTRSDEE